MVERVDGDSYYDESQSQSQYNQVIDDYSQNNDSMLMDSMRQSSKVDGIDPRMSINQRDIILE